MSELIRSICVDTLTAIQNEEYMRDKKKPGHDQWRDFGADIYTFMGDIQNLGFEIVLILGEPGKIIVSLYNEIQNILYSR